MTSRISLLVFLAACGGTGTAVSSLAVDGGEPHESAPADGGPLLTPPPPPTTDPPPQDASKDVVQHDADAGAVDAGPCPGFTDWEIPPSSCLFINTEFSATHLELNEAGAPVCSPAYPFGMSSSAVCIKTGQYPATIWVSNTSIDGDRVLYVDAGCPPAYCP